MIAAVVLAAGASTRLGQPKQLATIGHETLLQRTLRIAREAGCAPIIMVLGAAEKQIRLQCDLSDALIVTNAQWSEGMASSIRAGVAAALDSEGLIVMTCDQPAVTTQHLRALANSSEVTASSYAGRRGVPAFFPSRMFSDLLHLAGDAGARELLRNAASIELAEGELDVDTPDALARARELFG